MHMNVIKKIPTPPPNNVFLSLINWLKNYPGKLGLGCLATVLLFLSILSALNLGERPRYFATGEMANRDVVANRDIVVEDTHATQVKRDQVSKLQPGVFSLHQEAAFALRAKVQEIFTLLNQSTHEDWDTVSTILYQRYNLKSDPDLLKNWSEKSFQDIINQQVLPFLDRRIREGVIGDFREFLEHRGGIIIQDPVQASD